MPNTGPRDTSNQQDRFLQCEEDLEAEFQALVWKAIAAGWDEGEACAAIASLADHHILAIDCNNRTSASIRKLRETKGEICAAASRRCCHGASSFRSTA